MAGPLKKTYFLRLPWIELFDLFIFRPHMHRGKSSLGKSPIGFFWITECVEKNNPDLYFANHTPPKVGHF